MNRFPAVLAALAAVLLLSSCDTDEESETSSDTRNPIHQWISEGPGSEERQADEGLDVDSLPDESRDVLAESVFPTLMRDAYPSEFGTVGDDLLNELGRSVCNGLDSGMDFQMMLEAGVDQGYSYGASGYLLGAAISGFCPEYDYVIP